MGVDVDSIAIIGVEFPGERFIERVTNTARGCNCDIPKEVLEDSTSKWCPKCGVSIMMTVRDYDMLVEDIDDPDFFYDSSNMFMNKWPMCWTSIMHGLPPAKVFIGVVKVSLYDFDGESASEDLSAVITKFREFRRDLKKVGLWDEGTFGLHLIQSYS